MSLAQSPSKRAHLLSTCPKSSRVSIQIEDAYRDMGMPSEIYEDMEKRKTFLIFAFLISNSSIMWAYFSCLSAQDYYVKRFPNIPFSFLTTLMTCWPMLIAHIFQLCLGFDKRFSHKTRVLSGYVMNLVAGVCIVMFSAIQFENENLGGTLVLVCFGFVGVANSLAGANFYSLAALFPVPTYTHAVQIGNGLAGVLNISLSTVIRLTVGGIHQTDFSTTLSFYIFFGLLAMICIAASMVYLKLINLPCVKYLLERGEMLSLGGRREIASVSDTVSNLMRVGKVIWMPMATQFMCYFITLAIYPGFSCSSGGMLPKSSIWASWYCSPGIIASFNYGDAIGRFLCSAAICKLFTMARALGFAMLRSLYIPLLLMGIYTTKLYVFGSSPTAPLLYQIVLNLTVGVTNGMLSTITMGAAPHFVGIDDREAAGAVMVLAVFLGLCSGSLFGYIISHYHWFGIL